MNYLRTIVSGKKKRFIDEKYNLDLSYITSRIIAMAFPASGIEKIYRNSIDSVSKFLKERHKENYIVINLSGKKYDYSKFNNRVLEYEWVDHHAPPLKILFQICEKIQKFLSENDENVVAINCLAGKGRTGTIICCFMLYCGRFSSAEKAFDYYSKKRFCSGDGVTQPSQKRYVYYFEKLLYDKIYFPYVVGITDVLVNRVPIKESDVFKPFIELYLNNGNVLTYTNKLPFSDQRKIFADNINLISLTNTEFFFCFCGDITLKIFNNRRMSVKKIARTAFNSAFLEENQDELVFKLSEIDPDSLVKKSYIPKDLEIRIKFGRLCNCNNRKLPVDCEVCKKYNHSQLNDWKEIHEIINANNPSIKKGSYLLFGNDEDDVDAVNETDIKSFRIQILNLECDLDVVKDDGRSKTMKKSRNNTKDSKEKDELNNSYEGECLIF